MYNKPIDQSNQLVDQRPQMVNPAYISPALTPYQHNSLNMFNSSLMDLLSYQPALQKDATVVISKLSALNLNIKMLTSLLIFKHIIAEVINHS